MQLWFLFELSITIFQSLAIIYFIFSSFNFDFRCKRAFLKYTGCSALLVVATFVINELVHYEGLAGVIYSLLYFIFEIALLRGSIGKKIFIALYTNVVSIVVSSTIAGLMAAIFKNKLTEIYSQPSLPRFIGVLIVQALMVYVYSLSLRVINIRELKLRAKEWVLVFSVLLFSFSSIAFIHIVQLNEDFSTQSQGLLLTAEFSLIIINVVCFYMTIILNKSNNQITELKIKQQMQEFEEQYAQNAKNQYEEMRRMRHDTKQSYAVIKALIVENKTQEALSFINGLTDELNVNNVIDVDNDFVNAILNSKLSIAQKHKIEVMCSIFGEINGIADIDLCNLLGNLLDNAIEANDRFSGKAKYIELRIVADEVKITITVVNASSSDVYDNLTTTKTDSGNHGFGIKTIKAIAHKYNGKADFVLSENQFESRILLFK